MTPDPNNLYLGAGELWFDRLDASGNPTGLRHLGNVDTFTTSMKVDTVQKKSAMSGARTILAQVVTGEEMDLTVAISEYDAENLALGLMGTTAQFTQTAQAGVTGGTINGGAAIVLDTWYDIGSVNITVTDFKQAATTLDPQAYELRADVGMVRFKSSYTGTNKATAAITTWDGSVPAVDASANKKLIYALGASVIKGHLRYVSALDQTGPRFIVDVWKASLNPDGDLPFLGTDFSSFNLKGVALQDISKASGQQYARVIQL